MVLPAEGYLPVKKPLGCPRMALFRIDYTFAFLSPTRFRRLSTSTQSRTCLRAASREGSGGRLLAELMFSRVRSEERARWRGESEERSRDVLYLLWSLLPNKL
jgi:hypothetical protein